MTSGLHILLVDASGDLHRSLDAPLRAAGHEPTCVTSGEAALAAAERTPYALVMVDLELPGMSGLETLDAIKERRPDVQIIVITTHANLHSAVTALRAGACDYLLKPFTEMDAVINVVHRAGEKLRLVHDNRLLIERLKRHNQELEQVNRILQELAVRDGLTGLYNHRYFHESLNIEHARARRYNRHYSVLVIDVDHFKKYNDLYGHPQGDDLLRDIAEILLYKLRLSDTVARYGGEEFAVILPETDKPGAQVVAENLRRHVAAAEFAGTAAAEPDPVTISIGLATYPDDGDHPNLIIQTADLALFRAKNEGRNQVKWLDGSRPLCGSEDT